MKAPPSPAIRATTGLCVLLLLCMTLSESVALGDIVTLYDGRTYEGTILESTDSLVRIDAMVAGVRVKIGLPRRDIETIDKMAVPADFYAPKPQPVKRVSDPKSFKAGSKLYLEVPIVGRFGVQVVPDGVKKCLSYAAVNKIEHIVFFIDSQGGEQVAAKEIYDLLARYDKRITYHAVVRDSVGVAMAVTVWCDNVFLLPGANLGGTELVYNKNRYDGDPAVFLSQVAFEVGAVAEQRGWPAGAVPAMIDPSARFAAWVDETGQIVTGVRVPGSVSKKNVVVADRRQSVLTLTRNQAAALGVARKFSDKTAALGYELGIEGWRKESDYGSTTLLAAARTQHKRMERVASKNASKIKKLLKRREVTRRYIERCLALAHKWDSEYKPDSRYRNNRARWDSYWGGAPLATTTTRTRWRALTDTTLDYLYRARAGVLEMLKLDDQAERLGIDPEYKPGELDGLLDDLVVKIEFLRVQRSRRLM